MTKIKKITIPQPCHEDWAKMTAVEKGRHCNACEKTVIDFQNMTNEQVIDYFLQAKNKKTCGNFSSKQLDFINHQLKGQSHSYHSRSFLKPVLAVALLSTASCHSPNVTGETKVEKTTVNGTTDPNKDFSFRGKVDIDKEGSRSVQKPVETNPKSVPEDSLDFVVTKKGEVCVQ